MGIVNAAQVRRAVRVLYSCPCSWASALHCTLGIQAAVFCGIPASLAALLLCS
jgi:hypothetical protein